MTRPTWDEVWLRLSLLMAERSLCPTGAGAVIVDVSQRVVMTGYAGPPAGYGPQEFAQLMRPAELAKDGCQLYCERSQKAGIDRDPGYLDCPSAHAEANTLVRADQSRMQGGTFYISSVPCFACAKMIANSGVRRAVWYESPADEYRSQRNVIQMFKDCSVACEAVAP
jgi:dCMP deaminase